VRLVQGPLGLLMGRLTPRQLTEGMADPDKAIAKRVFEAMMTMGKDRRSQDRGRAEERGVIDATDVRRRRPSSLPASGTAAPARKAPAPAFDPLSRQEGSRRRGEAGSGGEAREPENPDIPRAASQLNSARGVSPARGRKWASTSRKRAGLKRRRAASPPTRARSSSLRCRPDEVQPREVLILAKSPASSASRPGPWPVRPRLFRPGGRCRNLRWRGV